MPGSARGMRSLRRCFCEARSRRRSCFRSRRWARVSSFWSSEWRRKVSKVYDGHDGDGCLPRCSSRSCRFGIPGPGFLLLVPIANS